MKEFRLFVHFRAELILKVAYSFTEEQEQAFLKYIADQGGLAYIKEELDKVLYAEIIGTEGFYEDPKRPYWLGWDWDFNKHLETHPHKVMMAGIRKMAYENLVGRFLGYKSGYSIDPPFTVSIDKNELSMYRWRCDFIERRVLS